MTFEEVIQIARENEWWDIEPAFSFPGPQSAQEFYATWEQLTQEANGVYNVECFVPLLGVFDFRNGTIHKINPIRSHPVNGMPTIGGTCRPATNAELADLDWNIQHGCVTLRAHPCSKFSGWEDVELIRGLGRPFMEIQP